MLKDKRDKYRKGKKGMNREKEMKERERERERNAVSHFKGCFTLLQIRRNKTDLGKVLFLPKKMI